MIIDAHTRLNNYHEEKVLPLLQRFDNLWQVMQENKVDQTLILTSY